VTASLAEMLAIFDVEQAGPHHYVGGSDAGERDVIDGSQLLAQAIVAASKSTPEKTVRSAHAVFFRPVKAGEPINFDVDVLQDGRTFATGIVTAGQRARPCSTITALLDTPTEDVIRHPPTPPATSPQGATPLDMPVLGREIRLVGVVDPNDPDEVGPAQLDAWLHYDQVPARSDLARALLAHFTGHLSISTTMRAHPGVGTSMAHLAVSTAVMAIGISFHDPIAWDGWLLYDHESTSVGAGMSYVRGQIRDEAGRLLASFTQDAMIRSFANSSGGQLADRARL